MFTTTTKTVWIETFYKIKTFDNSKYKFKIFDTTGAEKYRSISYSTIKYADGIFMVFAVDNKYSFEIAIKSINNIEEYVNLEEKVII